MFLEDELFDERAICEAIFRHSAEAIIITDQKGKIVQVNPAALQLFQYTFYELITKPIHVLLPEDLRTNHQEYVDGYSHNPHARSMGAGRVLFGRKKEGEVFPLSASLSPAYIGQTKLVVALVIDLTELEENKRELKVLNQELETKVAKRTKEIADTIAQLEQTNSDLKIAQMETQKALQKEKDLSELKSRFVSMASHEFRTPLSTILSSLSLIEKYDSIADSSEKKAKHYDRIKGNVRNLTSILNDFLSLDKLQSGAIEVKNVEFDLCVLAENLFIDLEAQLNKKQTLKLNFIGKKIIKSDRHLIQNILMNLLSNAIKYSKESGEILVNILSEEKVKIEVIDQGIGIPEEDKQHMFERFFRAHNASNIQGTGLGLTIVKRYLDLLGGEISFESQYGIGTTFVVII